MLLISYRLPNITRGPKRAMKLTKTFLSFNPNHLVLGQSLCILAFPLNPNVDSSFKIEELLHPMAISLNNCRVGQKNHSPLPNDTIWPSVVIICSDSWIFCLFICESVSLFLDCSVSLVALRPRILSLSHSTSLPLLYLRLPFSLRHNCRRHSPSMLVLSLTLTHTTSMGIWHSAGATKS